jgi:hypothetical protein
LAVLKDQLTHTHGEYLEWIGKSFLHDRRVKLTVYSDSANCS